MEHKDISMATFLAVSCALLLVSMSGHAFASNPTSYENALSKGDTLDQVTHSICMSGISLFPLPLDESAKSSICDNVDGHLAQELSSRVITCVVEYISGKSGSIECDIDTAIMTDVVFDTIESPLIIELAGSIIPDTIPFTSIISQSVFDEVKRHMSMLSYVRIAAIAMAAAALVIAYAYGKRSLARILYTGFAAAVPATLIGQVIFSYALKWDVNKLSILSYTDFPSSLASGYLYAYAYVCLVPLAAAVAVFFFERSRADKVV